jgi:hypothetical protein
MTTEDPNSIGE